MRKFAATLLVLLMFSSVAHAAALALGTKELRLNGGVDFDGPGGTDMALKLGYGYFMADYMEVGGLLGFTDNDYISTLSAGGFLEYNFETESAFIPYVGSQIELMQADIEGGDSEIALTLGLYAGGKYFVNNNLAINGRFIFLAATEDAYLDDKLKGSSTDTQFELGLNFYF